jgi:hypothetical protein
MLFFEFPLYGDFFLKTQKNKVKMWVWKTVIFNKNFIYDILKEIETEVAEVLVTTNRKFMNFFHCFEGSRKSNKVQITIFF